MIAATASWAIYGAVKQWINTADRVSAEEFVSVAVELVRPIVMVESCQTPQVDVPQSDAPTTTAHTAELNRTRSGVAATEPRNSISVCLRVSN